MSMSRAKGTEHRIIGVEPGSIAEEMEIAGGDVLVSVNGRAVEDIFDYRYLVADEYIVLVVRKPDGEEWELEIEKDYGEDPGIIFESGLMDDYRSCRNKCIFCFIDQMPKGMRETLYFKDDDSRLSFLQGNYITLTNMSDHDIDRIIRYHLEPINISFHTMNPKLRCEMLHNRHAGDIFPKVDRLKEAGIEMNGQIVLCKGINDGEELDFSMREFERYLPELRSVSIVPVGLTKFREGLYPLEPFTKEDAEQVIDRIEAQQKVFLEKWGTRLVHPSDEWYFLAGRPFPPEEAYEEYRQLENGVGMVRLLITELDAALEEFEENGEAEEMREQAKAGGAASAATVEAAGQPGAAPRVISLATGRLMYPVMCELVEKVEARYPHLKVHVYAIRNDFFGERITVSGLLTGQDLIAQLGGQQLGTELLLPCNLLRSGEQVLLDDVTVADLENALQIKVRIVKSSGRALMKSLLGMEEDS